MILTVGKVILHEAPVAFIITPSLLHFVLLDAIHDIKEKKQVCSTISKYVKEKNICLTSVHR